MVDRAVSEPALRVQLISKPGPRATGIGRYAYEIEQGLRQSDVDLARAELQTPLPGSLTAAVRKTGYDLDAFSRSYPLRARTRRGYLTHLTSQTLATLLLTQRLPRPVVVTVHDILPYILRDDPALCVYRHRMDRTMDALAMRGLKRADRLIAISQYTKQTLVETLAFPKERIDVVYNGVDPDRFRPLPVPSDFRARYGLPADGPAVLFVGSDDPRKNLPTALRAIAILRRRFPQVIFVKIGKPAFVTQRAHHLALCAELGIPEAVFWLDDVSDDDLPLFYNAAAVVAAPSWFEGFGLPVLEAMACGVPVVAFQRSSIPEIVGDVLPLVSTETAVAFADGLQRVLDGASVSKQALVTRAHTFFWDRTVRDVIGVYRASRPLGNLVDGSARYAHSHIDERAHE
jgi:glycosyltransferase involved in cell wall biosynthesis